MGGWIDIAPMQGEETAEHEAAIAENTIDQAAKDESNPRFLRAEVAGQIPVSMAKKCMHDCSRNAPDDSRLESEFIANDTTCFIGRNSPLVAPKPHCAHGGLFNESTALVEAEQGQIRIVEWNHAE